MISLFYDLQSEDKINFDIENYIEEYCDQYLKLKEDFDYYYNKYTKIKNKKINKSFNEELLDYESEEPQRYIIKLDKSNEDIKLIDTNFMKYSLMESLKRVIEIKNNSEREVQRESKKYKKLYDYYPDIDEFSNYDNYLKNISLRKEFAIHHIPKGKDQMDQKCNPFYFELSPHQLFLKNLLNNDTPYNGILIFHGVGVGKTCSGVSIAENFKHTENKTIILASDKIQEGWKRTIFNPHKGDNQCTGDEYNYDEDKYEKNKEWMAEKRIKGFYKMYGYLSFANSVKNLLDDNLKNIPKKDYLTRKEKEREIIQNNYSDRVLIIDEVHNIRNDENNKMNKESIRDTIFYIEKVIKYSQNLKLILLTANPMFNNYNEIVWILNMLLMNDNREVIKNKIEFDSKNELTKESQEIIRYKSRGYISYLRGENPFTFPIRLYPQKKDKLLESGIQNDIFGTPIESIFDLSFLKLYKSTLRGRQLMILSNELDKLNETIKISEESKLLQLSNCCYPSKSDDIEDMYGKIGIMNCFSTKGDPKKYSYKKDIPNFLDLSELNNYSSKIYNIIKNINKSDGISFIYSNYLESGVLPLILALEQNGYKHYSGNEILINKDKSEPISYEGKLYSKYKDKKKFKQGKYIVISGSFDSGLNLTQKNFKKELEKVVSQGNSDGSEIKIIIGSTMAAEGLDFKNIRSIHLLEPWHNLNKLEQVIGRGIRNCSHMLLDPKDRNVTIYLYTTIIKKRETIETYLYRRCEIKSKQIGQLELILKDVAIDKYLFRNANIIQEDDVKEIDVKPSYRTHNIIKIKPIDYPYTRSCSFLEDCDYITNRKFIIDEIDGNKYNSDTFSVKYSQDIIYIYKKRISNLISEEFYLTFEDIQKKLSEMIQNNNDDFIIHALNQMLNEKYPITSMNGKRGYLTYSNNYYIFQPMHNNDIFLPLYYRLNEGNEDKNEYIIEDTNISRINIPEIQLFSTKEIENKLNEIIYKKLSSHEEYVFTIIKDMNNKQYEYLRYSYIVDRFTFKDKSLLMYALFEYLLGDSELDSKYKKILDVLLKFYEKLFIYNETDYEWLSDYKEKNSVNLYGGFLYYHQRKEYKFFYYNSKRLILCNEIRTEDIMNDLSLLKKKTIFNALNKTYGFLEYNRNYRLIQNGLIMKIKKKKDRSGIIYLSSSGTEWSADNSLNFIKNNYKDIWSSINKKYQDEFNKTDKKGKLITHKLVFAVFIELCFRMSELFIQGDLVWFYEFCK